MIIDFHTHIFPPWLRVEWETYLKRDATFAELFATPDAKMATAEQLIRRMDQDGVDISAVMGIGWTDFELARAANDYIIESIKKYPDRLVGFAGVNPVWANEAVKEVERCASAGLRGIGELHPDTQGFDLGDRDTMAPLMAVAKEYGLIVTTHSSEPVGHDYPGKGETGPEVLWRFIQNFPEATIICAHWGGGLPFYALMPEVSHGLANVYFDSAVSPFLYQPTVFETVASVIGVDHVLLGSDYPLLRVHKLVQEIDESSLSNDGKAAIKGGNAARLLGI